MTPPQVKKIAAGFASTTGFDFEELHSVASLSYARAIKDFKPGKGSALPTWLYANMRNDLTDHVNRERKHMNNLMFGSIPERITFRNPESDAIFRDTVNQLSRLGKKLCYMIFQDPVKYLGMDKKSLTEYLRSKGWKYPQIWKCFDEICNALNSVKEN